MSQPTHASGTSFSIDIDRAPQAIRDLEDARDQLESLISDAQALGSITPPANDQVSIDAARALSEKAVGGPGSLVVALREGVSRMNSMIDDMKAELDSYRNTENNALDVMRADVDRA